MPSHSTPTRAAAPAHTRAVAPAPGHIANSNVATIATNRRIRRRQCSDVRYSGYSLLARLMSVVFELTSARTTMPIATTFKRICDRLSVWFPNMPEKDKNLLRIGAKQYMETSAYAAEKIRVRNRRRQGMRCGEEADAWLMAWIATMPSQMHADILQIVCRLTTAWEQEFKRGRRHNGTILTAYENVCVHIRRCKRFCSVNIPSTENQNTLSLDEAMECASFANITG